MTLDRLNDFAVRFGDELFRIYPAWRQYCCARLDESGTGNYVLEIEVLPPAGSDIAHPLWIATDRDEVSIGVDHYHAHFEWPGRERLWSHDPLMFIAALLADDVAVVSYTRGGQWLSSTAIGRDRPVDTEYSAGATIRVRSWNDTRNQDITVGR